jgi:2-dehydro-3-deoxyphosphogluconate aldolase/(4S)-4-hydroxy-2-oxoglutarate aldolase
VHSQTLKDTIAGIPVIPVIVIDDLAQAVPLARALVDGGLRVLEVTLRTPVALDAVRAIVAAVPAAVVGVGSVIDPEQFARAADAGAKFAVSPGTTQALLDAALAGTLPWLPAAQTVSEVLRLRAHGYDFLKFFPAETSGGINFLRSVGGPVADVGFCPTGGIDMMKAPSYLQLPNVYCVGGSWMCSPALVQSGDWPEITRRARAAAQLA